MFILKLNPNDADKVSVDMMVRSKKGYSVCSTIPIDFLSDGGLDNIVKKLQEGELVKCELKEV